MAARVDLNCDMGEGSGADEELLALVTSANIATGFHAGDPPTMLRTVRAAAARHVAVGAHPSLPDLAGFGRRRMEVSPDEVYAMIAYQVGALLGIARATGVPLAHVKPHGALYNMAATDAQLAAAICRAVHDVDPRLLVYGLAGSALVTEAEKAGLGAVSEVFADRGYEPDGTLTPRDAPGALIEDAEEAATRAVRMATEGAVIARGGARVALRAETICVHGDGANAVATARTLRRRLEEAGLEVRAPAVRR